MKFDDALQDGETILFESRAQGYPPTPWWLIANYIFIGVLPLIAILISWWRSSSFSVGIGTVDFRGTTPGGVSSTLSSINPFVFTVLVGACELWRYAAWTGQSYAVTARRILIVSGVLVRRLRAVERRGGERVVSVAGGARLDGAVEDQLALAGLGDAESESLRLALETFEPLPPDVSTSPSARRWQGRRVGIIVLGLCAVLLGWEAWTHDRVEVELLWTRDAMGDQIEVSSDSPASSERTVKTVRLDRVLDGEQELGTKIQGSRLKSGTSIGADGVRIFRTTGSQQWALSPAPGAETTVIRIEGAVVFDDESETPLAIDLSLDEATAVDLAAPERSR